MDKPYLAIYRDLIKGWRMESAGDNHIGPDLEFSYEDIERYADKFLAAKILKKWKAPAAQRRDLLLAELMAAVNNYFYGITIYTKKKSHNGYIGEQLRGIGLGKLVTSRNRVKNYAAYGLVRQCATLWKSLARDRIGLTTNSLFMRFIADMNGFIHHTDRIEIPRTFAQEALKRWGPYRRQHHRNEYHPKKETLPKRRKRTPKPQLSPLAEEIVTKLRNADRGMTIKMIAGRDFCDSKIERYRAALHELVTAGFAYPDSSWNYHSTESKPFTNTRVSK